MRVSIRKKKMKIGIKYCGGCNPNYDRIKAVTNMKEKLKDHTFEIYKPGSSYDAAFIVCGCPTACADIEDKIKRKSYLTSEEDFDRIIDEILRKFQTN